MSGDRSRPRCSCRVFVFLYIFLSLSLYVQKNPPTRARSCSSMLWGAAVHHKKKNHLCVCLCGWSPAWSRAGFSQVCCDLTGPLTGGTVNIWLSCDSRCGPQEAQKGQRLLMPLPTSKLSDFISPLVQPSHFKRTRHWRCCITSPRAQRAAWNTHPTVRTCIYTNIRTCRHATHPACGCVFVHVLSDSDSSTSTIIRHVLFANAVQGVN